MPSLNQRYTSGGSGISWVDPPASETATGLVGQWASDGSFLYMCYATNRWIRFASAGWGEGAPPYNTVSPAISGVIDFGETISCDTGTWGGAPSGFAYAWFVDGLLDPTLGSDNHTVLTAAYSLATVKCRVTATSGYGSTSAFSNSVVFPLAAPANTVAPSLSGLTDMGETLTCSAGTWTGSPSFAYAWFVDGVLDAGLGAAATLVITEALADTVVKCRVTATNASGSTVAYSNNRSIGTAYEPSLDFSDARNSMYLATISG
jgi:hypothetical protein